MLLRPKPFLSGCGAFTDWPFNWEHRFLVYTSGIHRHVNVRGGARTAEHLQQKTLRCYGALEATASMKARKAAMFVEAQASTLYMRWRDTFSGQELSSSTTRTLCAQAPYRSCVLTNRALTTAIALAPAEPLARAMRLRQCAQTRTCITVDTSWSTASTARSTTKPGLRATLQSKSRKR